MKKLVFALFSFFAFIAIGNTSPIVNSELENNRLSAFENTTVTVPSDVLQRFYDTFVYDENGKFRGAYIGEIENYATMPEIISIVDDTGVQLAGTHIYEGYKPKLRGCKQNRKWICTLEGDVVDL